MGEYSGEPGGEQWLPSQHAMDGAYDYLNPSSEEAGSDDGLAYQQYTLAAQADAKNAAAATGNFTTFKPDEANPN